MTPKITIHNSALFAEYIKSLVRLVPSCKMTFNKDGCAVFGKCGTSIRACMKTNSASSDTEVSFCLREIQRLHKCMKAIADFDPQEEIILTFNSSTFLQHSGAVKFKLRTIKEEVIAECIDTPITAVINDDFGFLLTIKGYTDILNYSNVSSSDKKKVYLSKSDKKICAELNNKDEALSDSIGFPVSETFNGDWQDVICTDLETFRLWNVLKTDEVNIQMTDRSVVRIRSSRVSDDGKFTIEADLISRVLKK